MAIMRICKYGDKILRKKTEPVDFKKFKNKLKPLLKDMFKTMETVGGIGLSANQVGVDMRLAIIRSKEEGEESFKDIVLINPQIVEKIGSSVSEEGCLSLPRLFAKIKRFYRVKVLALNEKGLPVEIVAEGLLARAFQHEIDHLNGKLFIDRLPLMTRIKLRSVLKKLKKEWAEIDETKMTPADFKRNA